MSKPSSTLKKLNLKEKINDDCLDLSMCNLDKVPVKEILEFPKIKKLNLSYNHLHTLPQDFAKLQHIKEIDLSKNHLRSLPTNFGSLINLKTLDLLGNQLTTLPSSFCELKSLQWLDLKDNPLEVELRKVVGECGDEAQCKRCAMNVVKFMKQVAAEEERKRQAELRKLKDQQAKQEAEEMAKEKEFKLQKKLEKEEKKRLMQQKKTEIEHESPENQQKTSSQTKQQANRLTEKKRGACQAFFSFLSFVFFTSLILVGFYVFLSNYCEPGNKLRSQIKTYLSQPGVSPVVQFVDQKMCPTVNANKVPYQYVLKLFQQLNF